MAATAQMDETVKGNGFDSAPNQARWNSAHVLTRELYTAPEVTASESACTSLRACALVSSLSAALSAADLFPLLVRSTIGASERGRVSRAELGQDEEQVEELDAVVEMSKSSVCTKFSVLNAEIPVKECCGVVRLSKNGSVTKFAMAFCLTSW